MTNIIRAEIVEREILRIRGCDVILDRTLADYYGVKTKALKQAVKRNIKRFPDDFMFVLNKEEFNDWRSQFVTSNSDRMGLRYPPMAFTELGVAMLSSVLKSEKAIQVNIQIMRAFARIRQVLASNEDIRKKLDDHDRKISVLFNAINKLIPREPVQPKRRIGFQAKNKSGI